jgi:hypothetical protein
MSYWKLSYDEQTYKQVAQSTKRTKPRKNTTDDIDIVGRSQSAVQDAAKEGLKINE